VRAPSLASTVFAASDVSGAAATGSLPEQPAVAEERRKRRTPSVRVVDIVSRA
jgi:hypothetical protein